LYTYPQELADHPARPNSKIFWIGLTAYVVSFLLPAITGPTLQAPYAYGYHCAIYSLSIGLEQMLIPHHGQAVMTLTTAIALFSSGMINVAVLAILGLNFLKASAKLTITYLKYVALILLPSCWFVFHAQRFVPVVGYYLWTGGMLVLIFAGSHQSADQRGKA
jgi:hypothetical protein